MTNVLSHFKRKYHFYSLSVLSGIFIGTSYIPYQAWAIFFCYIPLWLAVIQSEKENISLKKHFLFAWITQFTLTLIGFNWIYYTAREFGHLHPLLSASALLLFASFMHLYIPVGVVCATYLTRKYQLSRTQHVFLMALLISILERCWPSIFQWNLGYTLLWMQWPLFQWADTIGFLGLSSLIFLVQATLLTAGFHFTTNKKKFCIQIFAVCLLIITMSFMGMQKEKKWSMTNQSVNFALAQGNVGNEEKLLSELGYEFQGTIVKKYIKQTNEFLIQQNTRTPDFQPDIILWPETALPLALDPYLSSRHLQSLIQVEIKKWNSVLITGAYSHDRVKKDVLGEVLMRNSVFFLGPNGPVQSTYNKSQLLAFGEYLPMGETFPFLYKLVPFVGTFERGPGPVTKDVPLVSGQSIKLGPQICYESLDPEFSRELANSGSEIIFNVTNDSWFGDWAEPYQHLYMTLARGIENRRPLVRGTNTGISSIILANGQVLEQSKMNERWMQNYTVPYQQNPELTFYTRWGHWDWILLVLGLFFILYSSKRPQNSRRK